MKICFIQSDPIVFPGSIEIWANSNEYTTSILKIFSGDSLPKAGEFDLAIILGGRMGAYDENIYPWLQDIKSWINTMIDSKQYLLGICLGAQLIASALGAEVKPHDNPEVGWFKIQFNNAAISHPLLETLIPPETFFEFHFDTFGVPDRGELLASSNTCQNQIFSYGSRVLGLQFHPEFTSHSIQTTLYHSDNVENSIYAQKAAEMVDESRLEASKSWLFQLLDNYIEQIKKR